MKLLTRFIIGICVLIFITFLTYNVFSWDVVLSSAVLSFVIVLIITSKKFWGGLKEMSRNAEERRRERELERKRLGREARTSEAREYGKKRGEDRYTEEKQRKEESRKYWEEVRKRSGF